MDPSFCLSLYTAPLCCCNILSGFALFSLWLYTLCFCAPVCLCLFSFWLLFPLLSYSINVSFNSPVILRSRSSPVPSHSTCRLGTKLECSQMLNITVKALFSTWYGCSTSADTYTSDPIVTMGGKKSHETFYSCSRSSNIADLELPPQPWHTNKTLLLNNSDCRRILGALAVDGVQ